MLSETDCLALREAGFRFGFDKVILLRLLFKPFGNDGTASFANGKPGFSAPGMQAAKIRVNSITPFFYRVPKARSRYLLLLIIQSQTYLPNQSFRCFSKNWCLLPELILRWCSSLILNVFLTVQVLMDLAEYAPLSFLPMEFLKVQF